ncbi:MAG: hypothetical protein KGP14_10885 [Betaproteobacteria bacterium]|nr:hypothetical protein [Betaproteobacteria bacterium]
MAYPKPKKDADPEKLAEHYIKVVEFAYMKGYFRPAPKGLMQRLWPRLWFIWREQMTDQTMGLHDEWLLKETAVGREHLASLRRQGRLV